MAAPRSRLGLAGFACAIAWGLAGGVAPVLAAKEAAAPTIKDLTKRKVEIRKDAPVESNAGKAMENYRRFLELQKTDPAQRAEALRRLGDLSLESGELERLESEVTRVDLGGAEAIRLYTSLLKAHPDYPRNDQVLYQLARAYETTGQPEKALATLDDIVQRFPNTREIGEVQFRRGEILFSAMRYREAEQAYAIVARQGATSSFYQQSLYKQGWALFKQGLNDESLPVFARLLDLKLNDRAKAGGLVRLEDLARADREIVDDTLRVMSVTFSYQDGVAPLDQFVTRIGNPPYAALLYSRLGDLYVDKQRFQDAAASYRAFVNRDPNNEYSPGLAMQAIEAYRKGGFGQLVLDGKRDYVEHYNFDAPFWRGRDRANYASIVAELKTNLTDVAAYYHATAQKTKRSEDYLQAARWYRSELASFPEDPESAQINYRLADALFAGGQFADAVTEFERTAYTYPRGADSANAAYAALDAYTKQEALLPAAEKPAWHRRSIDSGVKFAQSFPAHPDSAGVLTRAAQDLYAAKDLPRAIEVAGILLARVPPPEPARQRIAHSIIGQSSFDTGNFARAESAWTSARDIAGLAEPERKALNEQLAAAVYRQAEAKRSSGDGEGAVNDFLRIAQLAPDSTIRSTAQYDAAAGLIALKSWPRAIDVLEAYRRDYPRSDLQADVTQKLAVAYKEAGRSGLAAVEFERIAARPGETSELRQEALVTAADLYETSGNKSKTVAILEQLVADYPTPVAERIEMRQRLLDLAAGNAERQRYWQRELVKADAAAGAARSDRTRYLAARARLALATPSRDAFRAVRLVAPLKTTLAAKRKALETALQDYREAAAYNVAEVTTGASFEMAELYRQLAADLLDSERPKKLTADEREQYDLLLEEQATPFEEQSIKLHEANAARARDGLYDAGVRNSYKALALLLPAHYGKTELAGGYVRTLELTSVAASDAAAVAEPAVARPPERAVTELTRAVGLAEAGQAVEAELEFKQLLEAYPAHAGPAFDLGLLLRGAGRSEESVAALRIATERGPRSPSAWNELGVSLRQQGRFADAAAAYAQALALDPAYAAAHRNLAVLHDLYLGEPSKALDGFTRYKELSGEDKPVTGWIAEVRQRVPRDAAAPTAAPTAVAAEPSTADQEKVAK
ncbi:MAG TPA: tetratricopeptide repeat protein [Steroidobacteraceae bacterium]|jgi:tetratricopeptide (TPR) repeat protein|nr:tetratricopeptide repeat protein [Steroidobacteraceae bacterium]